ncbi:MAG TPA: HAMP domain-containing sensor histidine kinase [Bryobacteraceae bacterium]|nr:HAMP domain-containing sensor histidine kinase [Bryobacteraceae bacterium]
MTRRVERRFRSLVERGSDTVFVLDARGPTEFFVSLGITGAMRGTVERSIFPQVYIVRNVLLDPAIRGIAVHLRDITGQAKYTELERFCYSVCHDLKSPLITIRGYPDLIESLDRGDFERGRLDIERIRNATVPLQERLHPLLDVSPTGRGLAPTEPVSFSTIAQEAVDSVAGPLRRSAVEVEIQAGMCAVPVDRPWAVQAVQNVVEPSGITIGSRENGETVFSARDRGIGIDSRHHQRIFELFEKLDTHVESTGTGLAWVKGIIEFHGGRIWVESEGCGRRPACCFTSPAPSRTVLEGSHT